MTLPNFIIIGAARSGTTALSAYLAQHPEILFSNPKEPHFFAFEGEQVSFQGPGDEVTINRRAVTDLDAYKELFRNFDGVKAVGEGSVSYLYYPKAVERIRHHIPNAKLICLLRNPADRAFSAYMYMRSRMYEPLDSFEAALQQEDARVAAGWHHIYHLRRMSRYYSQLRRYFDAFDVDQIRVWLYDDFRTHQLRVVQDVFRFLGVDDSFVPPYTPSTVLSGIPRNKVLHKFLGRSSGIKSLVRPIIPGWVRHRLYEKLVRVNLQRERIRADTRAQLLLEFRDDIARLEQLLERDLSNWLND